ncbi:MAG: hypothetical protein OEY70_15280, partial [Acidimicrobiia bacterium]|nr:hypothetical protein [Acidimicrobiia bacterium]
EELAAAVEGATRRFALAAGREGRPYTGHLTLGRLWRGNRTCDLVGEQVDVVFRAHELELVVSTPQVLGHRHEVVHRWGLPSVSAA